MQYPNIARLLDEKLFSLVMPHKMNEFQLNYSGNSRNLPKWRIWTSLYLRGRYTSTFLVNGNVLKTCIIEWRRRRRSSSLLLENIINRLMSLCTHIKYTNQRAYFPISLCRVPIESFSFVSLALKRRNLYRYSINDFLYSFFNKISFLIYS